MACQQWSRSILPSPSPSVAANIAFMFVINNHTTEGAGGQLCLVNKLHPDVNYKVLAVEFDTWQNPEYSDVSNNHVGVKKIKSWSFGTRQFHEEGMPIFGNPNSLRGKQIAGFVVGAWVGGMICIGLRYKLFRVFGWPLRFFLSHAGGEDQEGKNFPDRLRDELTSSWKLKYFIKVFLDRRSLLKGNYYPDEIKLELEKTEVGVVVVTKEFFKRKLPMTELVAFVESRKKNPGVKLLPLFYRMSPDDVSDCLKEGIWEEEWTQMATNGNHPIPVEDCRNAVIRLQFKWG